MTKQKTFTKEFEAEAVRLAWTIGQTRRQTAQNLGIGLSTLTRWLSRSRDCEIDNPDPPGSADMVTEVRRLRRGNEILPQERDIYEEGHSFFRQRGKPIRFALTDQAKSEFPVQRLCKVLGVSQSGHFAYRGLQGSKRQREDMVLLAHVRSAFAQSNGTYGSPRIARELLDNRFAAGRRRPARLTRDNDLRARQKRRFKRTTDSEHAWPIAPDVIDQDFTATAPNEKWGVDTTYVWTREGWPYLAVVIDLFSRRGVGWAAVIGCTAE